MHFQDSLLCKWKQGEKRNCPYHGTCDNQRNYPQFSCKQSVTKAIWDAKGNRAIGKSKEAKEVNLLTAIVLQLYGGTNTFS